MPPLVLILGGTAEARALASALVAAGVPVVSSLAGRVRDPALPAGEVRVGGFGGVDGLAVWIADHDVTAVVDATHPFASTMTAHAVHACAATGVPLVVLRRPGWPPEPGWVWADSLDAAAALLPSLGERVFLTTGRTSLAAFAGLDLEFLIRCVDPPAGPLPRRARVLLDRGPFTVAGERELLRAHRIDVLVTKDSGGPLTAAKLAAAREEGVRVLVVRRPPLPDGVEAVATVEGALARLRADEFRVRPPSVPRASRRVRMSDIQEIVAGIADELVGSGAERGLQVAAYVDQQPVVDVAAGVADPATGRPVRPGTLFSNWSIGKGATATLVHRLVDSGALTDDTPVAEVWPEFARHGKQAITVRQVLNHSAGVPALPADVTVDAVCSWPAMVAALEDAQPWWEPGTKVGYHAYTFGHLAGEIVRRVTGGELGAVLGELTAELGRPGEIRFGIAPDEAVDLAVLEDAPTAGDEDWTASIPADAPLFRAVPPPLFPTAALGNDPRVIAADLPAGAKVTARALARLYASWLGPVDGARLVSAERLAAASAESSSGTDQIFGNVSRWGLGFGLGLPWDEAGSPRAFGMAGAGGSWAGADPDRGLTLAVTRNVMSMDFTTVERIGRAVLAAVDR